MGKGVAALALVAAAAAGFLGSVAFGGSSSAAVRTVTVTLRNGATGPAGAQGPAGPTGPPGAQSCPVGFEPGELVLNAPGGQVRLFTCLGAP